MKIGFMQLDRAYLDDATLGTIYLPNGDILKSIERPWRDNKPFVSCIPEGMYRLELRPSKVVERTSKGKYLEGWEITNVIDREFIMFHIANYASDLEGCVGTGMKQACINNKFAVASSSKAFDIFMDACSEYDAIDLLIKFKSIEWP